MTWSGTGVTSAAIPYVGFNRYYDYNCEIWVREYVPTKLWMTVIQEELTPDVRYFIPDTTVLQAMPS